jgi:CheY-like chemotaxis protein
MIAQPTIIIVDDDPGIRESLEGLLRSVGLQVKALASVPEFVNEGRPEGPACLVLDVRLPGRSGRKRSVSGPVQAAARVALNGCQFQGRSSAIRRAGWSAMRTSTSVR